MANLITQIIKKDTSKPSNNQPTYDIGVNAKNVFIEKEDKPNTFYSLVKTLENFGNKLKHIQIDSFTNDSEASAATPNDPSIKIWIYSVNDSQQ